MNDIEISNPENKSSIQTTPSNYIQSDRVRLVEVVQTPLGFFVLAMTIIEGFLTIPSVFASQPNVAVIAISTMAATIFLLIIVVAVFAWKKPEALLGQRADRDRALEINDIVVICHKPLLTTIERGNGTFKWDKSNDGYAGEVTKITNIQSEGLYGYKLAIDQGEKTWPREWLVLLN
jgi:hypothetical protein